MIRKLRIAVDHGNKNMKTCNQVFTTARITQDKKPARERNIFSMKENIICSVTGGFLTRGIRQRMNAFLFLPCLLSSKN